MVPPGGRWEPARGDRVQRLTPAGRRRLRKAARAIVLVALAFGCLVFVRRLDLRQLRFDGSVQPAVVGVGATSSSV